MNKSVIIIVPSLNPTSPIKAALALANILIEFTNVSLISLNKSTITDELIINKDIRILNNLNFKNKNIIRNFFLFKKYINKIIKNERSFLIISFCLIPDIYNSLLFTPNKKISSIRANNIDSYYYSFGFFGYLLGMLHYLLLNLMDKVIVMHKPMHKQISNYLLNKKKIICIPNFLEKNNIDYKRAFPSIDRFKIIFVGSLDKRKDPLSLIEPIKDLIKKGYKIYLDIYGEGLLRENLEKKITDQKLENNIFIRGYSKNIKEHLLDSHLMILPSWSEGLPRSCLEALECGVPCVLRDFYGNKDVIKPKINGLLFNENSELVSIIEYFIKKFDYNKKRESLLPFKYERENIIKYYQDLIS